MSKNDDVEPGGFAAPSADIPDLRKKEKERKRSGVAWSGSPAAAARSAASASSGVASGAGLFAKIATLGLAGKAAAAAAALGGAGLLGAVLLTGGPGPAGPGVPRMDGEGLGGIASSLKVRSGGNDRLGVDSKGEIAFDPVAKLDPKEEKAEEVPPAEEAPAAEETPVEGPRDRLAHDLSGAKLSGSMGDQFGGKNIFAGAGNPAAPKFGANVPKFASQRAAGKLAPMRSSAARAAATARSVTRSRSNRSIGQLQKASGMSVRGAQASGADEASASAANAFDANTGEGGALVARGAPDAPLPPMGGGAPGGSSPPTTPSTRDLTDIQNQVDMITRLGDQARAMKTMGLFMIATGVFICALAKKTPWPWSIGVLIAGLMTIALGAMQVQRANAMAEQAKRMGDALGQRVGAYQGKVVRQCVDQAMTKNGPSIENCQSLEAAERQRQVDEITRRQLEQQRKVDEPLRRRAP